MTLDEKKSLWRMQTVKNALVAVVIFLLFVLSEAREVGSDEFIEFLYAQETGAVIEVQTADGHLFTLKRLP